jgi:hypothetical protein
LGIIVKILTFGWGKNQKAGLNTRLFDLRGEGGMSYD